MGDPALEPPLLQALRAIGGWLVAQSVPCALIGGVAVALVSRPRTTRDIDVLTSPDEKH